MKRIFTLFAVIAICTISIKAQLVNYEVEIIQVERTNYSDCAGCGQPDPTWLINGLDNASPAISNTCIHVPESNTILTPVSVLLLNRQNTNATNFTLGLEGFEKNCENNVCTFTSYNFFTCFPSVFGDSRRCINNNISNVNFRTFAPCEWHTQTTSFCGDFRFTYRFRWSFNQPPAISVQPSPTENVLCPTDNVTLTVVPTNDLNGWATGSNYQWQVANITDCANVSPANWSNVGGANASTFTPPNTPGTRLYRVLVTANCGSNFTSNTTASNCVRVTYNPYGVPGDLPPPIQSGICGSVVLPGSTHPMGALLPPAIGAVNGVNYQWTTTGGSFNNTSNNSVVWTAPTTPGNYSITLTYLDACAQADAFTTCVVDVGSPDCDFAYVATTGTDDVFAGGPDNPYRTLDYALSQLNGRTYIRMAGGTYNESNVINMIDNLTIEGGYQFAAGIWTKISNQTTTLILSGFQNSTFTGSNNIEHRVGVHSNGASNWRLQDLTISTTNVSGTTPSNRGRSNYAILIQNGSANYDIVRCNITSGAASRGANGATLGAGGGAVGGSGGGAGGIGANGSGNPSGGSNGTNGTSAPFNAAVHPPYVNPAGANGNGGAGGVGTDNCTAGPGCGFFGPNDSGCDGNNGANGNQGADGRSWQVDDRPNAALANVAHFLPLGQAGSGQNGGGGGQGAGGNGSRGGQSPPLCIDCDGRNGGVGGNGGRGGQGGTGGFGSGGSFAIYTHNSNTGANLQNLSLNVPSQVALGGTGAGGSNGLNGLGGSSGACNGCVLPGQRCSGAGGGGARGGDGGRGRDGANGINAHLVTNGVASNPSTSIPNFPIISVAYNNSKACINSEITLTKDGPNSWSLPLPYVNDVSGAPAPLTTSSFSNGSNEVKVYSTTPGESVDMQVGGANFANYLTITNDNRVLPAITVDPSNVSCIGGTIDLSATSWGTEVEYDWRIYQGNNVNSPSLTPSTLQNPTFDLSGLSDGLYTIRYRVREICCGWSIPVYDTLRIDPLPTQFLVGGGGGYCPDENGAVVTLSGSEPGVTYILQANGAPVDSVVGNGAPISFAPQTLPANYTVLATRFTDCDRMMLGNVNISIELIPNEFPITGGGFICASGANVSAVIGLAGSQIGVNYQLYLDGVTPIGSAVFGTGNPVTFGNQNNPGFYTVIATFTASGCSREFSDTVTINLSPGPDQYELIGGGDYCEGTGGASISLVNSDVNATYQLLWNHTVPIGASEVGNGDTLTFANAQIDGFYSVVATDAIGCESIMLDTLQINQIPNPVVNDFTVTNVDCNGALTGSISSNVTGGIPPYNYEWIDDASNTAVGGNASLLENVGAGVYNLTVTDANGCSAFISGTVAENPALVVDAVVVNNPACEGGQNGSIEVVASGGNTPYTYSLNNGSIQYNNTFENLAATTYSIQVIDVNGCTVSVADSILDGSPFELFIDNQSDILCVGQSGEVELSVSGGIAPYEYSVDGTNFQTDNIFSNLPEGAVTFYAQDASGCEATVSTTILATQEIEISLFRKSDVTCFGGSNASLTVLVNGGTTPYDIEWNPGGFDLLEIENLEADNYTITVEDANGCIAEATYTVDEPDEIASSVSVTQPDCPGKQNGLAVVGANGGVQPYAYEWSTNPVQLGVLANQLMGNETYFVTITDANGCEKIDSAVVENPDPIEVNTVPSNVSCFAGSTGEVVIEVVGGSAPFTYELNGIYQTDSIYTGLTAGNYVVFVEDNKGCVETATFSISTVSDLEVDLTGNGVSNLLRTVRGKNVQLQANLVNNTGNIIAGYIWQAASALNVDGCVDADDCPDPTLAPLESDLIVVFAKEVIGNDTCLVADTLRLDVSQEFLRFIPTAFSPNNDANCLNEHFEINILGAENLDVRIFNRWGEQIFHNPNQQNGPENPNDANCDNPRNAWDGTFNGTPVPMGAYVYQLVVTYFDGTTENISGTVSVIR